MLPLIATWGKLSAENYFRCGNFWEDPAKTFISQIKKYFQEEKMIISSASDGRDQLCMGIF